MFGKLLFLLAALGFVAAVLLRDAVAQNLFKCTDARGRITYSNAPCGEQNLKDAGPVRDRASTVPGVPPPKSVGALAWPIDCTVGKDCTLGYPDTDKDGRAFNCAAAGYKGHEGTDIGISRAKMDAGTDVYAAADGIVIWTFDGKYDSCPAQSPDCAPPTGKITPGMASGHTVCTELGPYCRDGKGACFWCFAGGNVVVIRHEGIPGVFATRYDHFKRYSIKVAKGQRVRQGQVIGQVGSAGNSSGPHLHFEVWGSTYYDPVEPWAGKCGPNTGPSLWKSPEQPWRR